MVGRSLVMLVPLVLSQVAVLAPAAHAVTLEQKLTALAGFTQPTAESAASWQAAWGDRGSWADYAFDWSSDGCSSSPDRPLGFDFRMPCGRHDFGYRNFKAVNEFAANKEHVDDALYYDLKQVCERAGRLSRPTCLGLAWTYYRAVRRFGALVVTDEQIRDVRKAPAGAAQS
ncbi:MAG: phospholipase [Nonomuraea sp.]|nr:phospholipase [Nonomuraea sp.]NUP62364.1 phospholipase [Nonomuraea sp.]